MKNRLIITVTDVHGTRAFNVHQIAKKLIVFIILFVILIIGGGSWFINNLSDRIETIKIQKEKELEKKEQEIELKESEINSLNEKEQKLQAQNKFYSMQIKSKVEDIDALSSKLDDIEAMIGLKDEKIEQLTKETLDSISDNTKYFTLLTIPNGSPIQNTRVTSAYGYRIHPITRKKKFHRGIDLEAKMRTPIKATANGVVVYVRSKDRGDFGRVVKLQHSFGFMTIYAHLNQTDVKLGDVIRKGQVVGLSGNSGRSNGPHLHYEVRYGGKILDPKDFIKWNFKNYDKIFTKQRRVKWESLVRLISEQHKMVLQ
ncbi:M23 family metallopeptidase [Halarcobacter bivalviorum]|uniref:M23 family metallopeptidase n=1 Tax=Halarcobacter bivalviorum TaxID=663364 RepID=UPI00100AF9D5|nr:M23 family metallopeptidase [Halarcobacter bivalviorum]RXK03361.1 peptidase [Halarcobacter bivalviorum]